MPEQLPVTDILLWSLGLLAVVSHQINVAAVVVAAELAAKDFHVLVLLCHVGISRLMRPEGLFTRRAIIFSATYVRSCLLLLLLLLIPWSSCGLFVSCVEVLFIVLLQVESGVIFR